MVAEAVSTRNRRDCAARICARAEPMLLAQRGRRQLTEMPISWQILEDLMTLMSRGLLLILEDRRAPTVCSRGPAAVTIYRWWIGIALEGEVKIVWTSEDQEAISLVWSCTTSRIACAW